MNRKQHSTRRIGLHHIAFFRGYLEGLPLREIGERYLETGPDLPAAKRTARAIRDELTAAARRNGNLAAARLLRLPPGALPEPQASPDAPAVPTLEEFADLHDPDRILGEAELQEMWTAQYGQATAVESVDRRTARILSLRRKQHAAINDMEQLLAEPPRADHSIEGWLDSVLSERLVGAGIHTLGELIEAVNAGGYRWFSTIPKLGERMAKRVVRWLVDNEASLGVPIRPESIVPPRQRQTLTQPGTFAPSGVITVRAPATDVVPIESFLLPAQVDGSQGTNRAPLAHNKLRANNDYEAVQAFLNIRRPGSPTWRAYRKEAERFLLWAILERGCALSSLTVEDCAAYQDFLRNPQPLERWAGPRNVMRSDPAWRPFTLYEGAHGPYAGLSEASVKYASTVLSHMCQWLTSQHYLHSNPFTGLPRLRRSEAVFKTEHALSPAQWRHVLEYAQSLPEDTIMEQRQAAQLRFTLRLAYTTGMRLSELVAAQTGHLVPLDEDATLQHRYMLRVLGKGNVERQVMLPRVTVDALSDYLTFRGLSPDPMACPPDTPLIAQIRNTDKPVRPTTLYKLLRNFFRAAALALDGPHSKGARDKLSRATTHWLRHTFGSHAAAQGVPLAAIKDNLGHASLSTTSIYVNTEKEQRWADIDRLMGQPDA